MLKAGGHEKRIQKVKVKEEEVDPYKQSYGVSIMFSSNLGSGAVSRVWEPLPGLRPRRLICTDRNNEAQGAFWSGDMIYCLCNGHTSIIMKRFIAGSLVLREPIPRLEELRPASCQFCRNKLPHPMQNGRRSI
jgi:hypothetical protein